MDTIIIATLKFLGQSVASGLTWDIMKKTGNKFVALFKNHFVEKKYFKSEKQAEQFLQDVFTKESYNRRHPVEDMWLIYDSCTHEIASDDFKRELINWLNNNCGLLELSKNQALPIGNSIEKQVNKDFAQVTNIGFQYNYGSDKHGD